MEDTAIHQKKRKNQWLKIIEDQKNSELFISEYCQQHDISPNAFRIAKFRYKDQLQPSSTKFVELKQVISTPTTTTQNECFTPKCIIESPNGVRILMNEIDKHFLAQLLSEEKTPCL